MNHNNLEPEKLHDKTPPWFKEWHDRTFWHFKLRVEQKLSWHDKLLWLVLGAIIVAAVANILR